MTAQEEEKYSLEEWIEINNKKIRNLVEHVNGTIQWMKTGVFIAAIPGLGALIAVIIIIARGIKS